MQCKSNSQGKGLPNFPASTKENAATFHRASALPEALVLMNAFHLT